MGPAEFSFFRSLLKVPKFSRHPTMGFIPQILPGEEPARLINTKITQILESPRFSDTQKPIHYLMRRPYSYI